MVTSLFLALSNRGALSILDASFRFARASYFWFHRQPVLQPFAWSVRELLGVFYESSAVIGVSAGLMSASVRTHRFKGTRSSLFVLGCRESWNGQGPREAPSRRMSFWSRSCSDEDEVSLAQRESRADFPEVPLQLLDPSQWKLAA